MRISPYMQIILATIIFGSTGVFVKNANLPATTISFFRAGIPFIALLIFYLYIGNIPKIQGSKTIIGASVVNAIRLVFYLAAFAYTSMSNIAIIIYTWPVFGVIFSAIILKERVAKRTWSLILLSLLGILLIYVGHDLNFTDKDFIGLSSALISALLYSIVPVLIKKDEKKFDHLGMVYYQNLVAAIVFFPFLVLLKPFPTVAQFSWGISYGILIGLIGFSLFFSALRKIKAHKAITLTYVEVISALFFGVVIFSETITWNMIAGAVLIFISALLLRKKNID